MEGLLWIIIGFIVVGGAVVAILWSIGRGIHMLRQTYTSVTPHQTAQRILAWNLIEPGITIPNIVLWYALLALTQGFMRDLFDWLPNNPVWMYLMWIVLGLWPMILLFVIIPLVAQRSADPTVRWAARKTAKLGITRMIITIITYATFGIGMLVGVPLLFWSLKEIRLWNAELLGNYAGNRAAAAIVGGKAGMLVLPAHQITSTSDFKVLID